MSALATRLPAPTPTPAAFRGGAPLAADVRTRLESGFGANLGGVRVHAGTDAARLAQGQGARAFAYGQHVVLGPGESERDLSLMAHEVAHVLQQRGATQGVQRCAEGGCCAGCGGNSSHEAEAAQAASAISAGNSYTVTGSLATATPQFAGEDEGILSGLIWSTAEAVAPSLVPIMRRGPEGVLDWIKDKVSGAIQTVVDTAMAPMRTVADTDKFLHAHIGPLLASMQEAAARIAQNDCKPITDAAAKIEDLATKLITPVIEKIQGVVGKVGDFLSGVWDKFGTPVWDFLKKYAGARWNELQQLFAWVWSLVKPVRDLSAKAWTWLKNKLGIGEGPEGQDGILQWVQAKAGKAWDWLQAKIEPYKKQIQATLLTIAGVAALVSPAGPFILAGIAIYGVVQGVKWIRANLAGGNAIVKARAHAQNVLIPQMLGAIHKMTAAVTKMASSVSGKLGNFAAGLGRMVGAAASSALNFLVSAAQWVADKALALAAWAGEKLTALADWIQRALNRLIDFLKPVMDFLGKVGALVVDILALPLLLAGALWKKIPACIRDPFVDWIIPLILRQIDLFKELGKDDEAWAKTKAGVMRLVRNVFVTKNLQGAIRTAFDLLLQVFNVPIELLEQIKQKAVAAWDTVSKKPIAFIKNAVKALGRGLKRYADKLKDNLLGGLEGWLFGELADTGIAKPKSWTDPWDLVKFALDVLGLSMPHVFELLEKRFEKATVDKLRTAWRMLSGAWDWIMDMKDKKPAEVTKEIINAGKEFGKSVLEGIVTWIVERVALEISTMATAAAASAGLSEVLNAVRRIYRAIKTAKRWARTIVDMVNRTLDAVVDIAAGALDGPAEILHGAMKKATPAVIGFLGDQVGLGGVADEIKAQIDKLRAKVDKAILAIIDGAKALFASLVAGAKSIGGKVMGWLGLSKKLVPKKGGKHTLFFRKDGNKATLMMATDPVAFATWLNSIRNVPADLRGDRATALRLINEIARLEADGSAKNIDHSETITRHFEEIGRIALELLIATVGHDVRSTPPQFAGLSTGGFGAGMRVMLSSDDLRRGTRPGVSGNAIFNTLNLRRRGNGSYYVLGHLLSQELGGLGNNWGNLTPISRGGNNVHERIERLMKPKSGDTPTAYAYVVTPTYGRAVNSSLITAIQSGPDPAPVKTARTSIVNAEQYVAKAFVISLSEIDSQSGQQKGAPVTDTLPNDIDQSSSAAYEV